VIFLDASVLLAAEDTDDAQHEAASVLLRTGTLATLDLALYETTDVAITRWKDPEAAMRLRQRIWMIAELGTLIRVDPDLGERIAQLAADEKLSTYDAGYVAGAQRLGMTLASCDQRDLVSAGLAQLPTSLTAV
jgi:predicted nucleic acid-binding protein